MLGNVLRAGETTINNVAGISCFRPVEGGGTDKAVEQGKGGGKDKVGQSAGPAGSDRNKAVGADKANPPRASPTCTAEPRCRRRPTDRD